LNKDLESLKESPLPIQSCQKCIYPKEKFKEVTEAVKRRIFNLTDFSGSGSSDEDEMMAHLKGKFHKWEGEEE
jgi:hypothetical protein